VDDRALLHEVFTGVLAAAESERAVALHERAAALGERSRAGEHFHSTLSSVVPEFYRELEAAVAEVYPGEERLLTREANLRASIDRRNPYVDPMSFIQVERAAAPVARRGRERRRGAGAHELPRRQRHRRGHAQHRLRR
jgi:phosphoenolpyruvate carboxylase